MKIDKFLMTYAKYKKMRPKIPYVFQIDKNGQTLVYFGSYHTPDPKDKQYISLDDFWQRFLKKTGSKNILVLVEGGIAKYIPDRSKSILSGSEGGYMVYLAKKAKIKIVSPEPSLKYQADILLKYFPKDEIEYYFFARIVSQWSRFKKKPDFIAYVSKFLKADKKDLKWKNYEFSISNMEKIHSRLFKDKFNKNDVKFFRKITSPISNGTVINKVAEKTSIIRDLYILEEIKKYWNQKKNLFVVFGYTHAVMQRPAIEHLINYDSKSDS